MNQQFLPTAGIQGDYELPPETDSSGDVVAYATQPITGVTSGNLGILPEITLGSPQKMPDPTEGASNQRPTNQQLAPSVRATQTNQQPNIVRLAPATSAPTSEYWQTVVVAPVIPVRSVTAEKPVVKKVAPLPTMGGGQVIEEEEARPALIRVIGVFSLLSGGIYGLVALGLTYTAYLLDTSVISIVSTALVGEFSKTYPQFALLPICLSILSVLYIYLGFTIPQGSRRAWIMGLIVFGGGIWLIWGLGNNVLAPLESILGNPKFTAQEPVLQSLSWDMFRWMLLVNWVLVGLVALLLVAYKRFKFPTSRINSRQKWVVAGVSGVLAVVVGGYFTKTFITNQDADLGYTAAAKTAGFHIYRPTALPLGWSQTSKVVINEAPSSVIVGREDFVETFFDHSLASRVQGQPAAQIILRQVDVPAGFDLESFANSLVEPPMTVREVTVGRADGQAGFAVEKPTETHAIRAVVLRTSDNVLLLLSTRAAQIEDLIALANTLD